MLDYSDTLRDLRFGLREVFDGPSLSALSEKQHGATDYACLEE